MASPSRTVPERLLAPSDEFLDDWMAAVRLGTANLRWSSVAFVGLARNCAAPLANNLSRLKKLADLCGSWCLHVETNDNADDTVDVLRAFAECHDQASYRDQTLGRQQFSAEFAGPRTIALAEYRTACQAWVAENAADTDFTIVIDWDAMGGWWHDGALNSVGQLAMTPDAYAMASVSLLEHPVMAMGEDHTPTLTKGWVHYDAWALRGIGQPSCYWDAYTAGVGGWAHQWLPPVGSPPVVVASAFGGFCVYRTQDYLAATYTGARDCEHVTAHRSIAERTGRRLYINPSCRTIMRWMDEEPADGGQHGHD